MMVIHAEVDMHRNDNEQKVLAFLEEVGDFVSPTKIGLAVGGKTSGGLHRHSAWASPICKRLLKNGLVTRNEKGWYKYVSNH